VVMSRPVTVKDTTGHLSLEVPREWTQKSEAAPASTSAGALLVSTDTAKWQANAAEPGVFMGVLKQTTLPKTTTPPDNCRAVSPDDAEVAGKPAATFRYSCDDVPVVERYLKISATELVRIQVRSPDPDQLTKVLDSATYN
jgi:hypothetical protein